MQKEHIIMIILVIAIGYLWNTKQLDNTTFYILGGSIILLLLLSKSEPKMIDIRQAKIIAKEYIEESQREGTVYLGNIKILPEQELKNFLIVGNMPSDSELVSYKWDLLFSITGRSEYYYLVKVGVYGNILGISEIQRRIPIGKIEREITRIEGAVKTTEEFKEMYKEKEERDRRTRAEKEQEEVRR